MARLRKYRKIKLTKHHKIPSSRGGNGDPNNIKYVDAEKHRAFHFLFGNMTPNEIIEHIQKEWM